ncbi:kelch repeat-containing protein [Mucilaginibacter sp. CAU 1740]|uniref:Kelch repeat-containing protein n=1 Tax=Mucilaginibacter sp. CAU 1740 TaxID=3140365 RepID=UPI00325B6A1D
MPKLNLTIVSILLLFATISCKKHHVDPVKNDKLDTPKVEEPKGWKQLKNYPGTALRWTFGFSSNNKGYIVGGEYEVDAGNNIANVFQYNPTDDKWIQLKNYPGSGMGMMAGFSVNNKIYLGTGFNYSTGLLQNDFWEYDPSNDTWTQKNDFPGSKRQGAVSFAIGNYGYLMGNFLKTKQDLWKYTPATDQWVQLTDYPGVGTAEMIGVAANGKAYVGAGVNTDNVVSDFWEYDPALDKWTKKADVIEALYSPVALVKGTKIYVISGVSENLKFRKAVLIYDTTTDKWSKTDDFEGQERTAATGFVVADTLYFGLGAGSKFAGGANYPVYFNDFWKFNP